MTQPHFIVIGAMKSGTSTLAAQLAAQPGLFMTTPKEPNYFSDDAIFARGKDWYAKLFTPARPGDLCGEASTHYTKRPDFPQTVARLSEAVPGVRLIYMIRNPMARLVSHYIHAWSEGEIALPLEDAIAHIPQLVDYGRYGWQIEPYVEAFGREAVLLTSLERQKADPEGELARIAAHIGHDGPMGWRTDLGILNVSANRVRKLPLHGLFIDNPLATALRRALVPKAVRNRVRTARQIRQRPEIPKTLQPALETRFAEDMAQLAAIFPGDPSLTLAYPFVASAR